MGKNKTKIFIIILIVVIALLSIRVIFDSKFDDFDKFIKTRETYEGGPEKFDEDFKGLVEWEKKYKEEHPNATKAEINKAFNEAWGK